MSLSFHLALWQRMRCQRAFVFKSIELPFYQLAPMFPTSFS